MFPSDHSWTVALHVLTLSFTISHGKPGRAVVVAVVVRSNCKILSYHLWAIVSFVSQPEIGGVHRQHNSDLSFVKPPLPFSP